ncbi:MAG: alpha-mannosidase [Clostridia bacterium]|nr:alpha-mannosidase [Clostridia bacterium]
MLPEWKDRIRHWIKTLERELYEPLGTIDLDGFCTYEQLSYEDAMKGDFRSMPVGTAWGKQWEYAWLKGKIVVPERAAGKTIVMDLLPGGEATLFVDGEEFGTRRAEWVRKAHHYICDQVLTRNAKAGESFDLVIEAYAGQYFPNEDGCCTGPVRPEDEWVDDNETIHTVIGNSTFGIWHEEAYQLFMDVKFLTDMLKEVEEDSLLAARIEEALQQFTLNVDFEQPREARIRDYVKAREALKPVMSLHNGTLAPEFYAIGNAHIDICWLWPYRETERKIARTFAQQIRLMDMYPDYKFIQSQPEAYMICKKLYPKLYARIKEKIKAGQWIAEGSMWVEPDTNMSGGEALIRQLLYGKKFYQEEFGVDCKLLWLPDTFGYSAALPQILRGCGVVYLTTQKIFWTYNGSDRFPYHYFTWQGMDGSQITSFLHMDYTSDTTPDVVIRRFKDRVQRQGLGRFLLPYGYGDGGGGPARDYIENVIREKDIQGVPRVRFAEPNKLFEDCEKDCETGEGIKPTYVGELYFQCHRGTYTTQCAIKKYNRQSEVAMREAELWSVLAMDKQAYPLKELGEAWKILLRNQFHDILPGSAIARVYDDAKEWYQNMLKDVAALDQSAKRALVKDSLSGMTCFNSLSWQRKHLTKVNDQWVQVTVPEMGYSACADVKKTPDQAVACELKGEIIVVNNGLIRAEFNQKGEIIRLTDLESGIERVSNPANCLKMYKDTPRMFDAWDIDSMYDMSPVELDGESKLTVLEQDAWRVTLLLERKVSNSSWRQEIVIEAESRQITFRTHADWQEKHRLLKVAFPTGVHAEDAENEIQFGYVKRPTHRSRKYDADRFEVCNHRYTALHDEKGGAAVLNDCKYGVSMMGDEIGLTLLRAAKAPDPYADIGEHDFTYAYYVWNGAFVDSGVVQKGYELNVPVTEMQGESDSISLMHVDQSNIIVESVKAAEDGSGDVIVRLYEAYHAQTKAKVKFNVPVKEFWCTDMLENKQNKLESAACACDTCIELEFHPFEVKTVRIVR